MWNIADCWSIAALGEEREKSKRVLQNCYQAYSFTETHKPQNLQYLDHTYGWMMVFCLQSGRWMNELMSLDSVGGVLWTSRTKILIHYHGAVTRLREERYKGQRERERKVNMQSSFTLYYYHGIIWLCLHFPDYKPFLSLSLLAYIRTSCFRHDLNCQ